MAKNPVPMAAGVVSMMHIASGKEKLSNLSNLAGGPGNVYNEFIKDKKSGYEVNKANLQGRLLLEVM